MKQQSDIFKTRTISLAQKKELMWNIIEPGDPYDIRKSMIAKLPGQKKFMGPHLELVCLLQAAQIERLCTFLQQYSLKIREQQRVELDRHSYEIQIKQLSQKIASDEGFRVENEKLKDFIRKQSKQLEQTQRQQLNQETTRKYQDSLRQLQLVIKENNQLKISIQRLQSEVGIRNEQMRTLELNYQQELQRQGEKINTEKVQRENLQREKIDLQIQRQLNQKKNQEELSNYRAKLTELNSRLEAAQYTNRNLKEDSQRLSIQTTKNQQLVHTIKEYQSRFELLAAQIDRLNNCLRDKAKELNEQYVRVKQVEEQKKASQDTIAQLQGKVKTLIVQIQKLQNQNKQIWLQKSNYEQRQSLIHDYQSRMEKLSLQVERLNNVLRKKMNELQQTRKKCRQLELVVSNMEMVEKEVGDLRIKLSEVGKKVFQYEKQTTNQYQEIQRLNFTLKRMLDEINYAEVKLKNTEKQLQTIKKRNVQLQNELQRQLGINQSNKKLKQNYEQSLRALKIQIQSKYAKDQSVSNQINYIRSQLNKQNTNNQQLRSMINSQNQELAELKRAREEAIKNLFVAEEYIANMQVKISECDKMIRELTEKNTSMKDSLIAKDRELSHFKQKQQSWSEDKAYLQEQLKSIRAHQVKPEPAEQRDTFNQLRQESLIKEEEIQRLRGQIAARQAHINDQQAHIQWFENRSREADEKTNVILKDCELFYSENIELKNRIKFLDEENQRILHELDYFRNGGQRVVRTEPQTELKYTSGSKQSEATGLKAQPTELHIAQQQTRQYQQLRLDFQRVSNEARTNKQHLTHLIQQFKNLEIENQQLRANSAEQGQYYKKILKFSEEIDRLNRVLQTKETEIHNIAAKNKQYQHKISVVQQRLRQSNIQVSQLRENSGMISPNPSQISNFQNQLSRIRQQLQSVLAENIEKDAQLLTYQNKIALLGEEIQRLNNILKIKVHQNDELQQAHLSLRNQREQLIEQLKQTNGSNQIVTLYQQKLNLMKQEIERLNTVLREKMQSFTSLNDEYNSFRQNQELKSTSLNRQLQEYQTKIHNINSQLEELRNKDSLNQSFRDSNRSILADYERKIIQLSNEVERLNRLLSGNGVRIEQLSHRDNIYLLEIERLNNTLRIKVQECEEHNRQQDELLNKIDRLQQQLADQKNENIVISQNRDLFSQEVVKAKQQMYSYETRIKDLYEQFERLQVIMKTLKDENQSYRNTQSVIGQLQAKNNYLTSQLEKINKLLQEKSTEAEKMRLLIIKETTYESKMEEDLALLAKLLTQSQSVRSRVQSIVRQSQQIKKTVISYNKL